MSSEGSKTAINNDEPPLPRPRDGFTFRWYTGGRLGVGEADNIVALLNKYGPHVRPSVCRFGVLSGHASTPFTRSMTYCPHSMKIAGNQQYDHASVIVVVMECLAVLP